MVSIAIQAGGTSRRMGCDKALAQLAGRPLVRHVIDRVAGLGHEILLTTNRPREHAFLGVRMVEDAEPGAGALSGLRTALSAARGRTVLVLACDMPFLRRPLLEYLLSLATEGDIVVPRWKGQYEPLHAVYARSCLGAIEASLAAGNRKIAGFFPRMHLRVVEESEVARFDPAGRCFENVNTPEDLFEAERLLKCEAG